MIAKTLKFTTVSVFYSISMLFRSYKDKTRIVTNENQHFVEPKLVTNVTLDQ